jgi:lipoprotein NlpD
MMLALLLAACATEGPAPVEDRSLTGEIVQPWREPADASAGDRSRADTRTHTVSAGDTLYSIAFKNGVDFRDLARWNGIAAPYTIHAGQQLRLSDDNSGVQTSAVRETAPVAVRETVTATAAPRAPAAPVSTVSSAATAPRSAEADASPVAQARHSEDQRLLAEAIAREEGFGSSAATSAKAATDNTTGTMSTPPRADTTTGSHLPAPSAMTPSPPVASPPPLPPRSGSEKPLATATTTNAADPSAAPPAAAKAQAETPTAAAPTASLSSGGVTWRWPAGGKVIGTYIAGDQTKQGIDIGGKSGDAVFAAADGTVVYSGNGLIGYGELIIVKHNASFLSAYGHNRKRLVKEGDSVKSGQAIAEMGATASSREGLHFEIRRNGKPVDPLGFLPAK